jgi:hypothetical protein
LQIFGAIWQISSPDQAIYSLNRQQNNLIVLIVLMPMMSMG